MGLTMPMTGGIFSSGLAWVGGIFASLMLADAGSASSGDMPVVQYGALGLAAILVAGLLRMLDRQTKSAEAAHRQAGEMKARAIRVQRGEIDAGAVALDGERMGQHRAFHHGGDGAGVGG